MSDPAYTANIPTPHAKRYLTQLCKHFQHKLPVTLDEATGQITFSIGVCRLSADEGVLTLTLQAADAAQMTQLQDVVARHLLRFAFREDLQIDWLSHTTLERPQ
jgi:uncharacterized protein